MDDEETDARIGIDFKLVACVRLPGSNKVVGQFQQSVVVKANSKPGRSLLPD